MTWTGQSFSAGQVLTAAQMNNLQADITAQANGDAGAPQNKLASMAASSVDGSQIVASAVTQGKLSTTTGEVSDSGGGPTLLTLPGGEYGFYPQVKSAASSAHSFFITHSTTSTSYATRISIDRTSGTGTGSAQQRYIQASPPYDLGDGPIPLFIFLLVNKTTREIISSYIAPEAPWHHNGPTIIRSDEYVEGLPYRWVRRIPASARSMFASVKVIRQKLRDGDAINDLERTMMRDFYNAVRDEPTELEEITQAIKNADMGILPHPFADADLAANAVILLDPLSNITEKLLSFIQDEGSSFETTKLFKKKFFKVNTTPLSRSGPPGVIQLGFNWRQT